MWPETIPEALKQTINDWFWYREVCSDDKFNWYFNRVLNGCYSRYNQLLRIQPGISDYDWLVQNYKELQTMKSESGSTSKISSTDKTTSLTESGTNGNTRTMNTTDTTDKDTTDSKTHGGTLTTATTYGKTSTNSGTLKNEGDRTETGSISDSGSNSSSSDQMNLGKSNPQSISYSGATSGMPSGLDWSYPGSQGEQKVSSSGTDSNTRTFNNHKTTDDFTQTDARSNALGGTDRTVNTDARTESGAGTEDSSVTHTGTITDAGTNSASKSGTEGIEGEETTSTTGSSTDRTIETGRNVDIATLLTNAKQFIIATTAWSWLKEQLEPCFMGVYDI